MARSWRCVVGELRAESRCVSRKVPPTVRRTTSATAAPRLVACTDQSTLSSLVVVVDAQKRAIILQFLQCIALAQVAAAQALFGTERIRCLRMEYFLTSRWDASSVQAECHPFYQSKGTESVQFISRVMQWEFGTSKLGLWKRSTSAPAMYSLLPFSVRSGTEEMSKVYLYLAALDRGLSRNFGDGHLVEHSTRPPTP